MLRNEQNRHTQHFVICGSDLLLLQGFDFRFLTAEV